MTLEEIKKEFKDLIKKFSETNPEVDIFVHLFDCETGNGTHAGFGCPGCAAERIVRLHSIGKYIHTRTEGMVH